MVDLKTLSVFSDALKMNLLLEQYRPKLEAWEKSLPNEFTLGGNCAGHSECSVLSHHKAVEPLVFKLDPAVPGLYFANFTTK